MFMTPEIASTTDPIVALIACILVLIGGIICFWRGLPGILMVCAMPDKNRR